MSLLLINALYIFKKSSEPLIEQQQDKIHSRDVYHTARGVAGLLVMGKRYISRSFHLNFSSNCTVSAKHSVNALKGLINDPMETVTSLKTPSNIIWKNFWRYFIGHSTVVVNTLILIVSRVDATETRGKFSLRQQMPFQVPFFSLTSYFRTETSLLYATLFRNQEAQYLYGPCRNGISS